MGTLSFWNHYFQPQSKVHQQGYLVTSKDINALKKKGMGIEQLGDKHN